MAAGLEVRVQMILGTDSMPVLQMAAGLEEVLTDREHGDLHERVQYII